MGEQPLSREEQSAFLAAVALSMQTIAKGATDAYDAGRTIWALAMEHAPRSPDVAWPLWLIWGALTDMAETDPENRSTVEAQMRQAAEEWLALSATDEKARKSYLDRWVFQELGYEKPNPAAI